MAKKFADGEVEGFGLTEISVGGAGQIAQVKARKTILNFALRMTSRDGGRGDVGIQDVFVHIKPGAVANQRSRSKAPDQDGGNKGEESKGEASWCKSAGEG